MSNEENSRKSLSHAVHWWIMLKKAIDMQIYQGLERCSSRSGKGGGGARMINLLLLLSPIVAFPVLSRLANLRIAWRWLLHTLNIIHVLRPANLSGLCHTMLLLKHAVSCYHSQILKDRSSSSILSTPSSDIRRLNVGPNNHSMQPLCCKMCERLQVWRLEVGNLPVLKERDVGRPSTIERDLYHSIRRVKTQALEPLCGV